MINRLITNRHEPLRIKTNSVNFQNLIELTPPHEDPSRYQRFSSHAPDFKNNDPVVNGNTYQYYTGSTCKQKTADRNNVIVKLQNDNLKRMSVGLLNSQSLKNKTLLISDLITEKNISLLFLTETWIQNVNEEIFLKHASPVGYSYHQKSRPNGSRGGGVAVIYQDNIKLVDMTTQFKQFSSFESIVLSAMINGESVWFFNIYRPPPSKCSKCSQSFLGDFNIPWDSHGQSERIEFASVLSSMDLRQHIENPTHSKGHIMDDVITRSESNLFTLDDVNLLLSDHYLILGTLNFKRPQYPTTQVKYRKLKDIDIELFKNEIERSFPETNEIQDIESGVELYNSVLSDLLNKFAPLKTTTVISRPKKPWYNSDIASKKRKKRATERKLKSLRKSQHRIHLRGGAVPSALNTRIRNTQNYYAILRNEFVLSLHRAKKDYYEDKINSCEDDQKKLFAILNELMCKKPKSSLPEHTSELELAERFNSYFVNKIEKIRCDLRALKHSTDTAPDAPSNVYLDTFEPCSESELNAIINKTSNPRAH